MKSLLTTYVEAEYINKLKDLAQRRNTSVNALVNEILRYYFEILEITIEDEDVKIVKCPKCGAEYSSRLPACPKCEETRIKQYKEEKKQKLEEIINSGKINDSLKFLIEKELKNEPYEENLQAVCRRIKALFGVDITATELHQKIKELASNIETAN